ncbi:MAG TPA: response regulator [Candidatus Acidoferrum sp.]|nr:response regulator [Candidatus Acidoferrum sp.]
MFEELKQQYRQTLPDKIAAIRAMLQELRDGRKEADDKLRLLAHTLHGSGSTFGYPEISAAAKAVELAPGDELLKHLTQLIRVLVAAAANDEPLHRPAILIIDDDTDISNLLVALLNQKCPDHQVVVAATGKQAGELFDARKYALIVLDLLLTDGDGREILRNLRDSRQRDTPVFVLSGADRPDIRDECLALGAKQFFAKPFNPDRIADVICAEVKGVAPPAIEPTPAPVVAASTDNLPVLVAEDDELLANVIKHRLGREGYKVEHVADGAAALAALSSKQFSLAILDVKMPVKDGFEVLKALRARHDKKQLPVIMLTAMGSEKDVVRGYELGANDYMLKPFSPVELLAKVKSLHPAGRGT